MKSKINTKYDVKLTIDCLLASGDVVKCPSLIEQSFPTISRVIIRLSAMLCFDCNALEWERRATVQPFIENGKTLTRSYGLCSQGSRTEIYANLLTSHATIPGPSS